MCGGGDTPAEQIIPIMICDWAVCRKPGVTGRGLYELRPECFKHFNLYFHHYSRADQSKVWRWSFRYLCVPHVTMVMVFVFQAEEAQKKLRRQRGEDAGE